MIKTLILYIKMWLLYKTIGNIWKPSLLTNTEISRGKKKSSTTYFLSSALVLEEKPQFLPTVLCHQQGLQPSDTRHPSEETDERESPVAGRFHRLALFFTFCWLLRGFVRANLKQNGDFIRRSVLSQSSWAIKAEWCFLANFWVLNLDFYLK